MKSIGFILLVAVLPVEQGSKPQLVKFNYSPCQQNTGSNSLTYGIRQTQQMGDTLKISFGAHANCAGRFKGGVEYRKDSMLNLIVTLNKEAQKDAKGRMLISEEASCNCHFEFHYQITKLRKEDIKGYLINGDTFNDHSKRGILIGEPSTTNRNDE